MEFGKFDVQKYDLKRFNAESAAYQDRCLAFIDILGFADLIKRTGKNRDLFQRVAKILSVVSEENNTSGMNQMIIDMIDDHARHLKKSSLSDSSRQRMLNRRGVAFSDTVVLAWDDDPFGIHGVFSRAASFAIALLNMGVLVRGAVTIGPVYFEDGVVFGPALLDAYHLEHSLALYPRILISDAVMSRLESSNNRRQATSEVAKCMSMIRTDLDGLHHLDILSHAGLEWCRVGDQPYANAPTGDVDEQRESLRRIRQVLIWLLRYRSDSDLRVQAKLKWSVQYFNSRVENDRELGLKVIRVK